MEICGHIYWHEGQFLRPHHLQYLERSIYDRFSQERRLAWKYPYGVMEAKVSDDALENHRISFDRLWAIMPSGLEVRIPGGASLPTLDIKQAFASSGGALTVSLGVPLWQSSGKNVIDPDSKEDWRSKRTYCVEETTRSDENTGTNPQPILIRKVNARLLLDQDDRSEMEVLPVLRILHGGGEDLGLPKRDSDYVCPCMVLNGSVVLRELVRDLTHQILASRKELVVQINRGGFTIENMRGIQFEQMLRLRALNRHGARLSSLMQVPAAVPPFDAYVELRTLLAELAALRPDNDQFDALEYDHDAPILAFQDLSRKIRSLLRGTVQSRFIKIPFVVDESNHCRVAVLTDEALNSANQYYLGIKTRRDISELAKLVLDRDQFKLMPQELIQQRIFGVVLVHETFPPTELPAQVGLHYFRLNTAESGRIWERIKREKSIAARWTGIESSDFEMTLYMTVPDVRSPQ